jgi:hypothetical protein
MNKNVIAASCVAAVAAMATGIVGAANAQDAPPTVTIAAAAKSATITGAEALKAGQTRLEIKATRAGERGILIFKVKQGITQQQIRRAVPRIQDPNDTKRYGTFVASTFVPPGGTYATTVNLPAADYAVIDLTGRTAATRGFFTVGAEASTAAAPAPAASVGLDDYRFTGPSTLPRDGVLRVTNDGAKLHHALVFPLRPSVNTQALLRRLRRGGEPSERMFAGPPQALVELVSPGTENAVEAKLRPGKNLLVCFIQDGPRAKPHSALGMAKIVTVR